jgi:hypothetical protein
LYRRRRRRAHRRRAIPAAPGKGRHPRARLRAATSSAPVHRTPDPRSEVAAKSCTYTSMLLR